MPCSHSRGCKAGMLKFYSGQHVLHFLIAGSSLIDLQKNINPIFKKMNTLESKKELVLNSKEATNKGKN
ncbi:MAG: hypothetical protein ABIN89_11220 [Chitinophagaceae bacterium]